VLHTLETSIFKGKTFSVKYWLNSFERSRDLMESTWK